MDEVQTMASAPDTGLFQSNGLFSKLLDTAGDIYAINQGRKGSGPGSVYPTGQVNPEIVASENATANQPGSPTPAKVLAAMPYIIAAVGIIVVAAVAYRFAKR